ncbi:MAG: response regulator [Anaerolineae bacterium]|nr:response regulator [Anaerolineae bacterium]NUQ03490.1 response regulator [Anaerolineae bacterium]
MRRIVLIEDDANSVRMVTRLLERAGYKVQSALEGETGLELVAETQPDVVLVDLGLPDIDGQTIIAVLRQRTDLARTAVVAFTAWPEETAHAMLQAYGCDGVITKPINTRTFAQQVARYIQVQANAEG